MTRRELIDACKSIVPELFFPEGDNNLKHPMVDLVTLCQQVAIKSFMETAKLVTDEEKLVRKQLWNLREHGRFIFDGEDNEG